MIFVKIIGFIETSLIDWDGHIVASVYLPGCNFRCHYCHNRNAVLDPDSFDEISIEYVMDYIDRNSDFLDGIVISGGEATLHNDLPDLIRMIKNKGLKVKLDTNGTNPDMLQNLIDNKLIDYVAMDVKGPLNHKYSDIVGVPVDLNAIMHSIDIIRQSGIDYEFRTTVVPILMSKKDVEEIISDLQGSKKYAIQQFRPDYTLDKKYAKIRPYDDKVILDLAETAKKFIDVVTVRGDVSSR